MNLSELFIKRPIMTSLVMLAVMIFGLFAYRLLPVNDLPKVDFPTIQVRADLPGANPETMASAVATPLERQFSTIAGLDSMSSTNGQGISVIVLKFAIEKDIDAAAQDVQSAISKAARQLPADMPTPPSYQKVNPADQPVLYLALTYHTLPLWTLDEYAETRVAQRVYMISGVAQVHVLGADGKFAAYTGSDCVPWCGHWVGDDFSVAGNMLAGPQVVSETVRGEALSLERVTVTLSGVVDPE